MKIRVLELGLVAVVALFSWLLMFALECYYGVGVEKIRRYPTNQPPFPDHNADNILWFLQITDLHISVVNNFSTADALKLFCHDVIGSIRPSLVLVSGDLTHAKLADERNSQQFSAEWKAYNSIVHKCSVKDIPWLDIRGNHDDFNVPSFYDTSNYFRDYSMSWKRHNSRSYIYSHHTSFGVYNFVALDACPDPGPKRPYNFFGVLHKEDLISLKSFSDREGNHTVWFTHYPSAIISTDHHKLRNVMGTSIAHVCGHLHTLGGFIPEMYGKHPSGHLELELGDFVYSKRFRLMAFDHDLFSFVDTTIGEWPLVLITNPKDAKFLSPYREPVQRMINSTHIRILIFSTASIESIKLSVDGQELPTPVAVNGGPLHVSPWRSSKYLLGMHYIEVIVLDAVGRTNVYSQQFSLDGTMPTINKLPQLLLLTDLHSLFRLTFLFIWLALVSILIFSWITLSERSYFYNFLRTRNVFYPYLIFLVYFGIGPWYVGEITTGSYGFVCVHGVYLLGNFIPGSMTYLHGISQIMLVYIPLMYYFNTALSRSAKCCSRWLCNCVAVFSVLVQVMWALTAYPYGPLALTLSPGGTWPLLLTMRLLHKTFSFKTSIKMYTV